MASQSPIAREAARKGPGYRAGSWAEPLVRQRRGDDSAGGRDLARGGGDKGVGRGLAKHGGGDSEDTWTL